jgi:hypothetical protein
MTFLGPILNRSGNRSKILAGAIILLGLITSSAAQAQVRCEGLFQPPKSIWTKIRETIPGIRMTSAQEAFRLQMKRAVLEDGDMHVLIGEHEAGRFKVLGWAEFKSMSIEDQTVNVVYMGQPKTISMDSAFTLGKFRGFSRNTMGYHIDESGKPRLYFYTGFSANGYILVTSFRHRDDPGFDAFPYSSLEPISERELQKTYSKSPRVK